MTSLVDRIVQESFLSSQSVWRDWFDSNPLGRSQLWVEGSIPSSLTERGAHTCIEMFVKRVLISVPQHSLLKIMFMVVQHLHLNHT